MGSAGGRRRTLHTQRSNCEGWGVQCAMCASAHEIRGGGSEICVSCQNRTRKEEKKKTICFLGNERGVGGTWQRSSGGGPWVVVKLRVNLTT